MAKTKKNTAPAERDEHGNVKRKERYEQVCVLQAVLVGTENAGDFEALVAEKFGGVRIQYLEEVKTHPGDGGEGGRNDVFFAVHDDDIGKFALPRLQAGIRWVEDVFSRANYRDPIYDERLKQYRTHTDW